MILLFGILLFNFASAAKRTGPKDACVELVDYWNRSWFMHMPDFPKRLFREIDLKATGAFIDEYAMKVVVRRGCMFTGYAHQASENASKEVKVGENLIYGVHNLPNYMRGGLANYNEGLSRTNCFCDPTEATVNGHVAAPPPNRKCIEHHEFNEETQQCEWKKDPKICGVLHTFDGRQMMLEMPNWPNKKKYDANHYVDKRSENFHASVTNILVRQHCFATLHWNHVVNWKTMPTMGYGYHTVASEFNGLTPNFGGIGGTGRFVCECIK